MADSGAAQIDNETCISCGACVYQCPFGAIVDKSFILDVVNLIKESDHNKNYKLYAVVAPSISSQFSYAKLGQVITGIQELGFFHVVRLLWAPIWFPMPRPRSWRKRIPHQFLLPRLCGLHREAIPPVERACVPQPVSRGNHCQVYQGHHAQRQNRLIGPCTAKKMEFQKEELKPYIDSTITFEELQALFDSRTLT